MITILIADDHTLMREGLKQILAAHLASQEEAANASPA